MKILLATSNTSKAREIKEFLNEFEVFKLNEILTPFDIDENGTSFQENALIKACAVFAKLSENQQNEFVVLSDDSGICVDALGGKPGIYSARYSGNGATDASNRAKLISSLSELNLSSSPAHYTACIALKSKFGEFSSHGFMSGKAISKERGSNGFGYDALFIPNGYDKTLGELDDETKLAISHRTKALELMKVILKSLRKYY